MWVQPSHFAAPRTNEGGAGSDLARLPRLVGLEQIDTTRSKRPSSSHAVALFAQPRMLRTTAHPTLDRRSSRQHLDRVPVLPVHGTVASWGPFARQDTDGVPSRAVVYASGVVLSLFLVACGVMVTASSPYEWGPPQTPALNLGGGTTHGRHLTQWLAPVWYSLPTLFDAIYNLGEALTRLGIPEDYRAAVEINARPALAEMEEYEEEEYGFSDASVEPAEDDPPTDGFDAWGYETYDGRFGDTPFYCSR